MDDVVKEVNGMRILGRGLSSTYWEEMVWDLNQLLFADYRTTVPTVLYGAKT